MLTATLFTRGATRPGVCLFSAVITHLIINLKRRQFALAQYVFQRAAVPFLPPDLPEDRLGRPFRRIKAGARQTGQFAEPP